MNKSSENKLKMFDAWNNNKGENKPMNEPMKTFDKWRSRWVSSILEVFILKMISKKERYGGELVHLAQSNLVEDAKIPTVYAIIHRNIKGNFLEEFTQRDVDGVTRGTSRKYYKLTTKGVEYLQLLEDEIEKFTDTIAKLR